jgi:hypothetical protein
MATRSPTAVTAGHWTRSPVTPRPRPELADLCSTPAPQLGPNRRTDSAIWSIFEIGWTRGAGVSRCRRGAIRSVRRAPQRADPVRLRPAVLAGRAAALAAAGGLAREQGGRRQGPARQKGTAVSHHRRVRVPGGHAHPRPGDHLRVIGCPAGCPACCPESAARPGTAAQWPASGGRGGCAALAATRAPGHEPHDDEYGHRDQPDDDKRLERRHDPARSRDGKPDGENRAEDCPDDPAHVPSMPPDLCRR